MNRIKLQYIESNKNISIEFYTLVHGTKVTLLLAKLQAADFEEIKRLRAAALIELESLDRAMQFIKKVA